MAGIGRAAVVTAVSPDTAPSPRRVPVADGVTIALYDWSGDAAVGAGFVLVHGLASNARLWDGVARALAALGHPVVAIDQRGHGRASKPDTGYDIATVADDLAAALATLEAGDPRWQQPVAVGQSWGGNVVVELAARHPLAARGIACVDGGFIDLQARFPAWEDCASALAPPRLAGTPVAQMRTWMREGHGDWTDEAIDGAMANFEQRDDGTISPWLSFDHHLAVLRGMWEQHPLERLATTDVPVLWLPADSGDVAWTASKHDALAAAMAAHERSRVHWFSPADHDVHAQHPQAVAAVLHEAATDGFFG